MVLVKCGNAWFVELFLIIILVNEMNPQVLTTKSRFPGFPSIQKNAAGVTLPELDLKSGDCLGPGRRIHIQVKSKK